MSMCQQVFVKSGSLNIVCITLTVEKVTIIYRNRMSDKLLTFDPCKQPALCLAREADVFQL